MVQKPALLERIVEQLTGSNRSESCECALEIEDADGETDPESN